MSFNPSNAAKMVSNIVSDAETGGHGKSMFRDSGGLGGQPQQSVDC